MKARILHFGLIVIIVYVYFSICNYWSGLVGLEYWLVEYVAIMKSMFTAAESTGELLFVPGVASFTEEIFVVFLMYLCSVALLLPLPLYKYSRSFYGGFRVNASVVIGSIAISIVLLFHTLKLVVWTGS